MKSRARFLFVAVILNTALVSQWIPGAMSDEPDPTLPPKPPLISVPLTVVIGGAIEGVATDDQGPIIVFGYWGGVEIGRSDSEGSVNEFTFQLPSSIPAGAWIEIRAVGGSGLVASKWVEVVDPLLTASASGSRMMD